MKLTYIVEDPNGDYGAFYIDGNLMIDFETYEMGPYEVLQFLKKHNLLKKDVEYEETTIEFGGNSVEFPSVI